MMMNSEGIARAQVNKGKDARIGNADDATRANTYSLLARLLASPVSSDVLELLEKIDAPADKDTGSLGVAWYMLKHAGAQATVRALDDEYHTLFVGIGRGEVMPYSSWYVTGFLMERPLAVLRADLASLRFERQAEVYEPEDHVAALCETMGLIINASNEIPPVTQAQFFHDHIAPWMGTFFIDLQKANSACFYRAVGQLGEHFIELEKQYMAMLP